MVVYTRAHTLTNNSAVHRYVYIRICSHTCMHKGKVLYIPIWNNQDSLKHGPHCLLFYIKVEERMAWQNYSHTQMVYYLLFHGQLYDFLGDRLI